MERNPKRNIFEKGIFYVLFSLYMIRWQNFSPPNFTVLFHRPNVNLDLTIFKFQISDSIILKAKDVVFVHNDHLK